MLVGKAGTTHNEPPLDSQPRISRGQTKSEDLEGERYPISCGSEIDRTKVFTLVLLISLIDLLLVVGGIGLHIPKPSEDQVM